MQMILHPSSNPQYDIDLVWLLDKKVIRNNLIWRIFYDSD